MSNIERRPLILSLIPRGTPEHPRYSIADQFLRYWDGDQWTGQGEIRKATTFADANDALDEMNRLLRLEYSSLPIRKFCAPIYIDLRTENEISIRDLQSWLVRATKFILDSPNHGNGPVAGSLGTCRVEWGEIRELQQGK